MPHVPRTIDPDGGVYHVYARGNNKAGIFIDDEDRHAYLSCLSACKTRVPFKLYHYVLMGNHVHLMVEPALSSSLSDIMKRVQHSFTYHHKKKHGFIGQLWQGRFKSELIGDDGYLQTCGIYVELNPVRAVMVNDPGDYRWSSYRAYAFGEANTLLDIDPTYAALARTEKERQGAYILLTKDWQARPRTAVAGTGSGYR